MTRRKISVPSNDDTSLEILEGGEDSATTLLDSSPDNQEILAEVPTNLPDPVESLKDAKELFSEDMEVISQPEDAPSSIIEDVEKTPIKDLAPELKPKVQPQERRKLAARLEERRSKHQLRFVR